jgi:hypothetical protein
MAQQEQGGNHGENATGSFLKTKGALMARALAEGRFNGPEFNRSPGPEAGTAPKRPAAPLTFWERLHAGKKRNSGTTGTKAGGKYKTRKSRSKKTRRVRRKA